MDYAKSYFGKKKENFSYWLYKCLWWSLKEADSRFRLRKDLDINNIITESVMLGFLLHIKEEAKYVDIVVKDHIIVVFEAGKYFSFADDGLI